MFEQMPGHDRKVSAKPAYCLNPINFDAINLGAGFQRKMILPTH